MFRLLAKYHKTGSVYWQIYHKSEYKPNNKELNNISNKKNTKIIWR